MVETYFWHGMRCQDDQHNASYVHRQCPRQAIRSLFREVVQRFPPVAFPRAVDDTGFVRNVDWPSHSHGVWPKHPCHHRLCTPYSCHCSWFLYRCSVGNSVTDALVSHTDPSQLRASTRQDENLFNDTATLFYKPPIPAFLGGSRNAAASTAKVHKRPSIT